jgi:hypothetical protein
MRFAENDGWDSGITVTILQLSAGSKMVRITMIGQKR